MLYDRKTWECTSGYPGRKRTGGCGQMWFLWLVFDSQEVEFEKSDCMLASACFAEETAECVSLLEPVDSPFRNVAEVPDGGGVRLDCVGGVDSIWFRDV